METVLRAGAATSPRQEQGAVPPTSSSRLGPAGLVQPPGIRERKLFPGKGYNWPRAVQRGGSGLNLVSGSRSQWEPLGRVCPDGADAGERSGPSAGAEPRGSQVAVGRKEPLPQVK